VERAIPSVVIRAATAVLCTNKGTPNKEGETNGHSQGDATIGWPFLKQFTLP